MLQYAIINLEIPLNTFIKCFSFHNPRNYKEYEIAELHYWELTKVIPAFSPLFAEVDILVSSVTKYEYTHAATGTVMQVFGEGLNYLVVPHCKTQNTHKESL